MTSRSLLASSLALACLGLLMAAGGCANGGGVDGGSGGVGGAGASVTTGTKSGSTSSTSAQSTTGSSSTKSSTAAGMTTNSSNDASSSSSGGGTTTSTGTGGPMCTDPGPGEPNNSKAQAFNLGTIDDDDNSAKSVSGMLDETGADVDWYKFHLTDAGGSIVDPTRQLFGPGIRICKYIACTSGNDPEVGCPSGTTADNQGGVDGCCWTGGQSVTIDFGCSFLGGGDDSLEVWIRVDHQGGAGCEAYKVDYHG